MKIPSGSGRRKYTHAENSKENACGNVKKTCAVSKRSFLHEEGALGRAVTSRGCKAGWRGGRGKEGNEVGKGREQEGSEVRQRELAACKIRKAKTKSETERETVNWDWVAWQQRS